MRALVSPTLMLILVLGAGCKKAEAPGKGGDEVTGPGAGTVKAVLSLGTQQSIGVEAKVGSGAWRPLAVGTKVQAGAALRTAKGTRGRLELSDGSVLLLNQQTELELAAERKLKVRAGELLAQVVPAAKQPLLIDTKAGQVHVTGTKLNLRVNGAETVVDVTRGTVEVEGGGARLQVGAGERATVRAGERPRVSLSRDLVQVTRWSREIGEPPRAVEQLERGFGSLTARVPGQGKSLSLRLAEQKVRVTVRDNIARTEVEQFYYNSSNQTLEGTYRFPLPAGASIARLALYVGKTLMEGEVVERHRARQIFRQIVEDTIRPRDPALLEWMGGRTFQMKIFPIPPRAGRRVILAYVQPLSASYGRYSYIYPMSTSKGKATRVGHFSIDMRLSGSRGLADVNAPLYPVLREDEGAGVRLRYEASDFVPAASFVVNFRPEGAVPEMQLALYEPKRARGVPACALRGLGQSACGDRGGFFMAVLRPELPTEGRARRPDYLFLMDSSHGIGKEGWAVQVSALEAFLAEMDLNSRINVMACDERCRAWGKSFAEPTAETRSSVMEFARKQTAGGSSNLQAAFEEAAGLAKAAGRPVHVVYMGDGRPTAGELREPQLANLVVQALRPAGAALSVLQVGEDVAELFLAQATRQLAGAVHRLDPGDDLRSRVFEVVAAQYRPTLTDLQVSFEGVEAHHVYPQQLPSLTAGSEVILTGRYDRPSSGSLLLRGIVDGKPFERRYPLALAATVEERSANSFIPRLWAKEHLDALSVSDYAKNRPEIVRVSQEYSVLSRATAFLVLENERMYKEFKVRRRRLKDRDYWKGDQVASRTLKDSAQTTADKGEESAKAKPSRPSVDALRSLSGAGTRGRAAGPMKAAATPTMPRAAAEPAAEPAAPADDEVYAEKKSAKREAEEREPAPSADAFDFDGDASSGADAPAPPPAMAKPSPRPTAQTPPPPKRKMARSRRPHPGYYHRPRPYRVQVPVTRIEPILDVPVSHAADRREEQLRQRVAARPLLRGLRQAYHRTLVRNARYDEALRHAEKWAELDGSRPSALLALADMQAAKGQVAPAVRTYSATVELQPWNISLHRSLVQMYRNKGELDRSCAHLWSIVSLRPTEIAHHLALARCLAQLPDGKARAMQLLTDLTRAPEGKLRAQATRIGQALARIAAGDAADERSIERGALVLKATWDRPVDLDVAVIAPDGSRLSALRPGRRGAAQDSSDGRTAEVLALRWVRNGSYRIEVTPAGDAPSAPVSGTLLIRARGKTRAVPFVLSGPNKPVARLDFTTRWERRYR